jgi:hypothetical protein
LRRAGWLKLLCLLIPPVAALLVWLTPLAFVPVPWPDDSAFYFVAKSLFHWPPRWVMLPQAPFEPTYRIFNFNTMPLFPVLVGLGRFIGIDGSHWLKLWPLSAWAATGSLLAALLLREGLSAWIVLPLSLCMAFDPELRWGSVLVRPESMIGLLGLVALWAALFPVPKKLAPRGFWDPVAAALALAAYAHFNSVHLVIPVAAALRWRDPKRMIRVGAITALYLAPWALIVLWHWNLFIGQMTLQWGRLAVRNDWLDSMSKAASGLFQGMGQPDGWPRELDIGAWALWFTTLGALGSGLFILVRRMKNPSPRDPALAAGLGWVISGCLLWERKPEVWFVYYIHIALWVFLGFACLWLKSHARRLPLQALSVAIGFFALLFLECDVRQALALGQDPSWRWSTYGRFVDCVDEELSALATRKGAPLEVWCPTFPDVTVELSRRHPDWDLTRTNDFYQRVPQALEHGAKVDAVVVTEIWGRPGRIFAGPLAQHPEARSVWMTWSGYFLHHLDERPGWKPNRSVCGVHRWQAFIYEN